MKRRHAFQTVTVFLLIGTALLALGPVRQFISRRVSQLRESALGQIERALGREVTYQSISPSILNYLSVRGLVIRGNEGERDLLRVDRLRLYYRPLRLLQGRFEEAFSEIRIVNSDVFVDARLSERLESSALELLARNAEVDEARLPDDLIISARNLDVEIVTDEQTLAIDDLFFDLELIESVIEMQVNGSVIASDLISGVPLGDLSGAFELSGTVDLDAATTLTELRVLSVESNLFVLSDITLQIRLDNGQLQVRNVQSREPIDLFYRYDEADGTSYARVLVDGFDLASIIRFRAAFAPLNEFLEYPVRGQASVTSAAGGTSYGISLSSRITRTGAIPPGTVTVQLSGDESTADVQELSFRGPEGTVVYTGVVELEQLRPRGRLVVDQLSLGRTEPFSTVVAFSGSPERLVVSSTPFRLNGVPIDRLSAGVDYGIAKAIEVGVDFGGADDARLRLESEHDETWAIRAASLSLVGADVEDIVAIQSALSPSTDSSTIQSLFGNAEMTIRASADLAPQTRFRVREFTISDRDNSSEYLSLRGAYGNDEISIDSIRFSSLGVSGAGTIEGIVSDGEIDGSGMVTVEDVNYAFGVTYRPERVFEMSGERGALLRVGLSPNGRVTFESNAEIPLPSPGAESAALSLDASGQFVSSENWNINVSELEVVGFATESLRDVAIRLSASLDQRGADFHSISYSDRVSQIEGSGEAAWNLEQGNAAFEVSFENPLYPQGEWYILTGAIEDAAIEAELLARGSPVERFGVTTFTGGVNATLNVSGPIEDPTLSGEFALVNGRFNNDPLSFSASVTADRRTATVDSARGQFSRTRIESLSAGVSLASNRIAVEATLVQMRDSGPLPLDLAAQGVYDSLDGYDEIGSSNLTAEAVVSGVPAIGVENRSDWIFSISREEGFTDISGGPDASVVARFSPDGNFEAAVGGALPVSFTALGYLTSGRLEMDLIDVRADVSRFGPLFDDAEFSLDGGVAEGSLRVVGPLNDPDFYGTLVAREIIAQVDLVPVPLGPTRVFLVFEEKTLTARETLVPAGDALAEVSAQVVFDRWGVEQYLVTIETVGESPLPVDSVFGAVLVRGDARGRVEFRGDRSNFSIAGEITASSTTIAIGEEDQEDDDENRLDTTVDLTIESGRGVEFLWPNENVPILRGFADAGEIVSIAVQSDTGSFGVDGSVGIQGGEIFYFDRSFYITAGEIVFAEDQNDFDPRLSVTAEIREVSEEGPVRIYLVAEEKPLSQFSPRWRSDPPLSETDILALLGGTVFVSESGEPIDFSQAVLLTSDFVSQFGLIRNFERSVRDALQLDLFSIRTQLFQNLLRGVIDQNAAVPLDTAVPSLGQYLDNTTLFAGRYLGTDLFLELLVQVSESEPEPGSQQSLTGIEVDSEVSLEWETPFFQLEWAFFPRDPSTLFLTDNTIRFSWDFSY